MSVNVPTPENGGNVNRPFTYASMLVESPNSTALRTRFEPRKQGHLVACPRNLCGAGDI